MRFTEDFTGRGKFQNSAEGILVNGSPDVKTVREIGLKQADYFHKGFLTNFNQQKRIPIVTYSFIKMQLQKQSRLSH